MKSKHTMSFSLSELLDWILAKRYIQHPDKYFKFEIKMTDHDNEHKKCSIMLLSTNQNSPAGTEEQSR